LTIFDSNADRERSWQDIGAEVGSQRNPKKRAELTKKLERALDRRNKVLRAKITSDKQPIRKTG
jgi:hypothetical protein